MTSPSETYLDAAATAPLRPEARAAMLAVYDGGQANASSVHAPGHRAKAVLDASRGSIAAALGATPSEVIFTSGGTEANNLAIVGLALASPRSRHIVTTPIEHPSVAESCRFLERVFGFELSVLRVDSAGTVSAADVAAALRPDTTLVSIGLANAEFGTVQPIREIAEAVRASGARLHVDAVQAAASLPIDFGSQGAGSPTAGSRAGGSAGLGWPGDAVDALTVASHKFGGPQGVGALLLRRQTPIEPLIHGGGQERGARSGTENVAGVAGFAAAVSAVTASIGSRAAALAASRDLLVRELLRALPGARLTGHPEERLPGHASFVVPGVSGESLLVALDAAGFAVSSGSACAAGRDEPSPALLAIGLSPEVAQTAVRFTLAQPLGEAQIARIVATLAREVAPGPLPSLGERGA